jgi:hypothetical protein
MNGRNCNGCGKPPEKRVKRGPIWQRRTRLQHRGHGGSIPCPSKDSVSSTPSAAIRSRLVASSASTPAPSPTLISSPSRIARILAAAQVAGQAHQIKLRKFSNRMFIGLLETRKGVNMPLNSNRVAIEPNPGDSANRRIPGSPRRLIKGLMEKIGSDTGIRTRILALRGLRPNP